MRRRKMYRYLLPIVFTAVVLAALTVLPDKTSAVASGCPPERPTAITGSIYGYGGNYNKWTVSVIIGMDLKDANNQKVNIKGEKYNTRKYSYYDRVNPELPQPGAPSGYDRTFGAKLTDGNGKLCVSSKVKTAFFEIYPKDTSGDTDKAYYGEANDQHMPIVSGQTNSFVLRIPTSFKYNGNTGDINGYATYNGHKIDIDSDKHHLDIRVWPKTAGTACGVQGFSGGVDYRGYSKSKDATYYLIRNIAGGQCGAEKQKYLIRAYCNSVCGADRKTISKTVYVKKGARPRVDFAF